jgi:serine/threonine protein kinase
VRYLHGRRVIHADLKPANILMDKAGTAYVSDFGLSHERREASMTRHSLLGRQGTPLYMDPHLHTPGNSLTTACDVYSFGVLGWETLTCCKPFQGINGVADLDRHLAAGGRPDVSALPPELAGTGISGLLSQCWAAAPAARPAMTVVVDQLKTALEMLSNGTSNLLTAPPVVVSHAKAASLAGSGVANDPVTSSTGSTVALTGVSSLSSSTQSDNTTTLSWTPTKPTVPTPAAVSVPHAFAEVLINGPERSRLLWIAILNYDSSKVARHLQGILPEDLHRQDLLTLSKRSEEARFNTYYQSLAEAAPSFLPIGVAWLLEGSRGAKATRDMLTRTKTHGNTALHYAAFR